MRATRENTVSTVSSMGEVGSRSAARQPSPRPRVLGLDCHQFTFQLDIALGNITLLLLCWELIPKRLIYDHHGEEIFAPGLRTRTRMFLGNTHVEAFCPRRRGTHRAYRYR